MIEILTFISVLLHGIRDTRASTKVYNFIRKDLLKKFQFQIYIILGIYISEEPYMNVSVGLIRTVLLGNPDLVTQVLDLESGTKPDPRQLLEALVRLCYGTTWEKYDSIYKTLWTQAHELALKNARAAYGCSRPS